MLENNAIQISDKYKNILAKKQCDITISDCLYLLAFNTQSLKQPFEYFKSNAKFILGFTNEFYLNTIWNSVSEEMKGKNTNGI